MRRFSAFAVIAGAVVAACGNPNDLANPTVTNVETSVTLYALTGTPIATPSAYSLSAPSTVRIDQGAAFDFAFNFDQSGAPVFLPLFVLGLGVTTGTNAGFLKSDQTFESIIDAPANGYATADTVHVAVGDVYIARSRVVCSTLGVPQYGKLQVTAIDPSARTVTFRVLTDNNCGYTGLEPGLPPR